jgi:hypothetical protein
MKFAFGTAILALVFGVGGSATLAQPYPSAPYYHHAYVHRHGHIRGPTYGRSGEPLGPAYWGTTGPEQMPDPRTCGPGACQDNPRY